MQLQIDSVEQWAGTPLLLQFQNGYVTEEFSSVSKSSMLLSGEGKTVVAADIGGVLYAGEETQGELGKTLLLVRNKKTGKVRVVEVGSACLRAVLADGVSPTSQQEQVDALDVSRKFGSKRDKQKMEHREKLKVDAEVMNEQLKKLAEDTTALEKIDFKTFSNPTSEDFYIPRINRDAKHVKDLYNISDILSEEHVEIISNELESKDWISELHQYFASSAKKDINNTEKALILYANSLLKIYLEKTPSISKKSYTVCESSHTINELVLENFTHTVNNRRGRSNPLKDKTLCHVLVIALILNSYKCSIDELVNTVKLMPKNVVLKARAVGAQVSSDKKCIVLKVPLNTSKSFVSRRKSAKF